MRHANFQNILAISGHSNFGIHRFVPGPCFYVTMLRNPLDLAISYYHFILQEFEEKDTKHIHLSLAQKYSLCEFWQQPEVRNIQTSALNERWQLKLPGSPFLSVAKKNLRKHYRFIGIFEQREKLAKEFCEALDWRVSPLTDHKKKTFKRPLITDLSTQEKNQLEESLSKDLELYTYVKENLA